MVLYWLYLEGLLCLEKYPRLLRREVSATGWREARGSSWDLHFCGLSGVFVKVGVSSRSL